MRAWKGREFDQLSALIQGLSWIILDIAPSAAIEATLGEQLPKRSLEPESPRYIHLQACIFNPSTQAFKMALFDSSPRILLVATALRLVLLVYGGWQDAHSAVKYTDIDYMVFTDAARYVSKGYAPYARDTYRYTPLLSWMLLPTAWEGSAPWSTLAFAFGKALFALADVLAGWLVVQLLCNCYRFPAERALRYVAAVWLWNPMVANISTRGSAEGLLGVLVAVLLWATLTRRAVLAGAVLGLAVHFKIYPFIYGVSILWWWDAERDGIASSRDSGPVSRLIGFITPSRVKVALAALATFVALNLAMYLQYGMPFLHHTYFHHLTRIDHRHNFSPYNVLLYLAAAGDARSNFEALAFLPQLVLAVVALPLVLAKKSLATAMLAQTFAFVTFNKVCTSQVRCPYCSFVPGFELICQ